MLILPSQDKSLKRNAILSELEHVRWYKMVNENQLKVRVHYFDFGNKYVVNKQFDY
jgi:hypothetical protein